jgi:nucleotide-binding universal stress UspA family protein
MAPPLGFTHIVAATDFSQPARCAVDAAIELAKAHRASLTIMHAIESAAAPAIPLPLQEVVAKNLDVLARKARQAGVTDVKTLFEAGRAWDVIPTAAQRLGADLIVVGTHGQSPLSRLAFGSTADRVVRLAGVPVLAVNAKRPMELGLRVVAVATDFSEEASIATSAAVRLLRASPGAQRLLLIHACHTPVAYEPYMLGTAIAEQIAANEREARRQLDRLAAPFADECFAVECIAREGFPAAVIIDEAKAAGADLIALGTHGRSGVHRLLLGSVAERVLHHAPCPVLTVHKPATSEPMRLSA